MPRYRWQAATGEQWPIRGRKEWEYPVDPAEARQMLETCCQSRLIVKTRHVVPAPRAGMHQDVVDTVLRAEPDAIVYVSCNPATQARDLALLDS